MSIEPGQMLLHYRIVEKIGEGGMGAVWRAVDTHLDREVAVKLLPAAFSNDVERLARFDREAKLLASLNHPNIAGIYGFHPGADNEQGVSFLSMELVEGEDLAERLERGPLPVDEALEVARQIAEALEEAHAGGVIHRDLKPANVKLTPDGKVKVLDFGLAKALEPAVASGDVVNASLSPTLTSAGTQAGMILGTAAYMSPEQARGKPLDRRTDLWSFGCVLFECLTGRQLFRGETVSDSLAAILRKDPDWSELPETTPPMIRLLLRRLLTREPGKRIQDAGDARLELEQAVEDPRGESLGLVVGEPAGAAATRTNRLPWVIAAIALLLAVFFAVREEARVPASRDTQRLTIPVPGSTEFGDAFASPPAISPDGRSVVFGVMDKSGATNLWLRPLDSFTARPLNGTEDAKYAFWSADSRHIGFFQKRDLKRLELATGQIQTVRSGVVRLRFPRGASWHANGRILFVPDSNSGVHLIEADGIRQLTTPDPDVPDSSHRWPVFLPDGEHFLFLSWTNDLNAQELHGGVFVASIEGGEPPVRVAPDPSSVAYVPGFLFLMRGDNLVAIPFDADARRVTGEATVIATGVLRNRANGHVAFSASTNGNLVYAGGRALLPSSLHWYDRSGNVTSDPLDPAPYVTLRLAPDAKRAVTAISGPSGDGQLWLIDLVRGVNTRLAPNTRAWAAEDPVWSATGDRVMYGSQEAGSIDFYVRFADGSGQAEPVLVDESDKSLFDWSPDGKYVAFSSAKLTSGTRDIWIYSMERREAEPLLTGAPNYFDARFSPDGRWIAFLSDETGSVEVFVQSFGGAGVNVGARWRVSTAGGRLPHWRDDGREIVYLDPEQRMMAVSVEEGPDGLKLGPPRALFSVEGMIVTGDATVDHQRFIFATRDAVSSEPLRVILDWPADL